jgi:hypothetical protein
MIIYILMNSVSSFIHMFICNRRGRGEKKKKKKKKKLSTTTHKMLPLLT